MTVDQKCRICRRAGEKLFLKGDKCFTPNCVFVKKPYAPGKTAASSKRRPSTTEYGKQLKEKQKVRNTYGMREKQFSNYVSKSVSDKGSAAANLYERLEMRLDNSVFKLGLASSRSLARQMVSHGHILVNGRKTTVPSRALKIGDVISVREGSKGKKIFTERSAYLAKHKAPAWLVLSPEKIEGKVIDLPKMAEGETVFDFASVLEFYSR